MSRHQAYRNYDYENDLNEYDGEGYSDEEELSPEDQALMTAGTAEIRAALGNGASKVTTAQIQEALWHYYFDAEKALAFLVSKHVTPTSPKSRKKEPKKGQTEGPVVNGSNRHLSFANFFDDMPWMSIPSDRQTTFIPPPRRPGGLLGGAGGPEKMSKLQALALARKNRANQQSSEAANIKTTTKKVAGLTIGDRGGGHQENVKPSPRPPKQTPTFPSLHALEETSSSSGKAKHRNHSIVVEELVTEAPHSPVTDHSAAAQLSTDQLPSEPAAPSIFAQTLLGPGKESAPCAARDIYQLPYMAFASSIADAFSEPSPDDVVLTAQSKASNKKIAASTAKRKGGTDERAGDAVNGVSGLKIDDAPLPKSKNLNVLSEYEKGRFKRSASFVVVGHVDAGKSTLMGRLLLDLNVVDQRIIERYRKEAERMGKSSFALAWVLDQRTEERARGVTIDIATNKFETDSTSFTILDAPGHQDFIPNMIAGVSQADFAILVVDATTGAFESGLKGQTREHSLLLRSMGVSRVIVAVNKLDTVGWAKERFDEITQQVSGFLSATNFQLKNVSFVPVSGLTGEGLVHKSTNPAASWYTGSTLIEELENSEPTTRALEKPLRMTISEVFRTMQSSLAVSGRLDAGSLQMGDALLVQPSGEKAYVKSLELDAEPVDWAVAGQNVVIHLVDIDPVHVRVGDIVCDPKEPVQCIDTFTMKVLPFDILMPMRVDVHRGRLHAAGQITEIPAILGKVKGQTLKRKPKIVKPGSLARVVVTMASKVPLEAGQRVVLRSGGETVGAGLLE